MEVARVKGSNPALDRTKMIRYSRATAENTCAKNV